MDNTQTINILSLCTGYGGLELGLSRALEGVFRVVAVEVETYALANLACKAKEGKLAVEAMWPDLKTFPAERFRGCFDFILAGYPCQPFSVAGKRQGTDDPRHLWPHIARIIEAVRPVWCFFENVPGHLSIGFPEVYRSLRDMGYKVEAGLFTAAEVGAPHKRQRLFILAKSTSRSRPEGGQKKYWAPREDGQSSASISKPSSGQLAHSETSNDRGTSRQIQSEDEQQAEKRQEERFAEFGGTGQLANPESTIRRGLPEEHAGWGIEEVGRPNGSTDRWPARPGEAQYEWEEPRVVVANTNRSRNSQSGIQRTEISSKSGMEYALQRNNRTGKLGKSRQSIDKGFECDGKETQSGVGRAVDGTRNRVDRLRLLGNGVVPQQAEKAFRELMEIL